MVKLHFDIRDIFRAVRLGWSGKKIWIGLCGLVVAWLGYSILVSISHLTTGMSLSQVWQRYGLFPGAVCCAQPWYAMVINVVAMLYALAVIFLTTCMMCKITFQQLKGDDFYSSGDAWKFLKSNWSGVLLGPVAVLALLVFFVVVGIIIGWVAGIIPVVGELLFALSFIPIFFAAIVAVFIAVALVVAVSMSPAIVGTVGEDTLEVVIQAFSLVWSQPWRLVIYCTWMKVAVLVGASVLTSFVVATYWLLTKACGVFMGQKLANMLSVVKSYDPCYLVGTCPDVLANLPAAVEPSGSELWAGRILAVMTILIGTMLMAYVQAAYASGTSLIYVILRKRKDDENLLEWEEEDLSEETPAAPAAPETPDEAEEKKEDEAPADKQDSASADKQDDASADEDDKEKGEGNA